MIICVAGFACTISNYYAGHADDWTHNPGRIIRSSIGGQGNPYNRDGAIPLWYPLLHIVWMILLILGFRIWRSWAFEREFRMDIDITTPSDYTVMVSGLAENFDIEDLKNFFTSVGRKDGKPVEIVRITPLHDIGDYINAMRKLKTLENQKFQLEEHQKPGSITTAPEERTFFGTKVQVNNMNKLKQKITTQQEKIRHFEHVGNLHKQRIGQCFMTFRTQGDWRGVIDFWGGDFFRRVWRTIFIAIFSCCVTQSTLLKEYKGKQLVVSRAPEPTDVFFENLGIPSRQRFKSRFFQATITLIALLISWVAIGGLSVISFDYENDGGNYWVVNIVSFAVAVITVCINVILSRTIRKSASMEKFSTITHYTVSVALRLTICQFFNSGIIVLAVHYKASLWFVPGGLAEMVFYILLGCCFVQPFFYVFDPFYLIRIWQRRELEKKLQADDVQISQTDANIIFEEPALDLAQRYANQLKTFLVALAYAPIVPLGLPVALLGLLVEYWIDKWLLLRRHSRPVRISHEMNEFMSGVIPWSITLYAVFLWLTMIMMDSTHQYLWFIWLIFMIVYLILPLDTALRLCRKTDVEAFDRLYENEPYEEAQLLFMEDYDRENPVTAIRAWENYIKMLEARNMKEQADHMKRFYSQQFGEMTEQETVTNGLHNYAYNKLGLEEVYLRRFAATYHPTQIVEKHPQIYAPMRQIIVRNLRNKGFTHFLKINRQTMDIFGSSGPQNTGFLSRFLTNESSYMPPQQRTASAVSINETEELGEELKEADTNKNN